MGSTLRLHHNRRDGSDYCEQLINVNADQPRRTRTISTADSDDDDDDDDDDDETSTVQLEWKRSYVASHVNRLKKEARSERIALCWDSKSAGGTARYFPLNDDRVFSLTRCV